MNSQFAVTSRRTLRLHTIMYICICTRNMCLHNICNANEMDALALQSTINGSSCCCCCGAVAIRNSYSGYSCTLISCHLSTSRERNDARLLRTARTLFCIHNSFNLAKATKGCGALLLREEVSTRHFVRAMSVAQQHKHIPKKEEEARHTFTVHHCISSEKTA